EQAGRPGELYERPATRFVAEFIGESNIFPGVVATAADGLCTLDAAGVRLRAVTTHPPVPGGRAVVSVRPGRVGLKAGAAPAGLANAIGGRVTEVVYLGSSRKYVVRTDAGHDVISLQQVRSSGAFGFDIGAAVSLYWQAEDATVLPDQA